MAKILVVDDDINLGESVKAILKEVGHLVDYASSARDAEAIVFVSSYDLLVLDWEMPQMSGVELLKRLRSQGLQTPVLMLTGRSAIEDKEVGFEHGADDYLVKPFDGRELVSRVKAIMRRRPVIESADVTVGEFVLDSKGRRMLHSGREISLTKQEYALLDLLMRNKDEVFSVEAILNRAWSGWSDCSPDTVRVHITHLRKKLAVDGAGESPIRTVHRQGYLFSSSNAKGNTD
jgi:two-component system, OmpR family, response regulator TctD